MKRARLVIGIIGAAALAACGGSGGGGGYTTQPNPGTQNPGTQNPGPNPSSTNEVTLGESAFQPANISVVKGTTVTWKWAGCSSDPYGYGGYGTCVTHSVTFDDGSNIASPVQSEGTFTRTFATAGTFKYHCAIHGTGMAGQVTVQ